MTAGPDSPVMLGATLTTLTAVVLTAAEPGSDYGISQRKESFGGLAERCAPITPPAQNLPFQMLGLNRYAPSVPSSANVPWPDLCIGVPKLRHPQARVTAE
jgi:hypothetical protein